MMLVEDDFSFESVTTTHSVIRSNLILHNIYEQKNMYDGKITLQRFTDFQSVKCFLWNRNEKYIF